MSLYEDPRVVRWLRDPFWGALNHLTYHALRLLPVRAASAAGARLGLAAGRYRLRETSAHADRNLQRIRPDLSAAQRAAALARMWDYVGRAVAEVAVLERLWESAQVSMVNEASVRDMLRARRPVIFVFPHLGNWELLAVAVQRLGASLSVVFELLGNRFERSLAERSRRRLGYRLISPDRAGVRALLAALGRGEALGMAIDERKRGNVVAPAFGRPLPAFANLRYAEKLARRFDAPVVAGYCLRTAPLEFTLTFLDPLERPSAQQLNALCESWIRAHPEQWYMLHRLRFEAG